MDILSLHYLPSILWMRHLLGNNCIIDIHEHFIKQTYRNRAVLLSANGLLNLTVPVRKTAAKIPMKDIQPDHEVDWQRQHWESITACYGSAPFFIHYADGFRSIYEKKVACIADFELELLQLVLKYMKVNAEVRLSRAYMESKEGNDLRGCISPKVKTDDYFKPYLQVFAGKFPFQPNLSILDALFNLGPRTADVVVK